MTRSEAFFTLHRDLPREGPGEPADVFWALEIAGTSGPASVCDAACGPGADTVTLANLLPEARITAIDRQPHFVAETADRTKEFGDRVQSLSGDLMQIGGPYDLIWCAGAVYFVGIHAALSKWRGSLSPGGRVAFSEPVLMSDPVPENARKFWADYPEVTDLRGIETRVSDAGWQVLGTRYLRGKPWSDYYEPQRKRIATLRRGECPDALDSILNEAVVEISLWEENPDEIAYALLVVAPI